MFADILERKDADPEKSYTAKLLAGGPPRIAKKLGEEAVEAVIAALAEEDPQFIGECADVLYHLLVLVAARNVDLQDVYTELLRRRGMSGLDEKRGRKAS